MIRDTSREAYRKILDSLPRTYKTICTILWDSSEPLTSREIDKVSKRGPWPVESDKRMAEMVRQDLVQECPVRVCRVTGFEVLTYTITGRPRKKALGRRSGRPPVKEIRQELARIKELHEAYSHKDLPQALYVLNSIKGTLEWVLGQTQRTPMEGFTK